MSMFEMLTRDITAPYSSVEGFFYDRFIAPAVNDYVRELQRDAIGELPAQCRVLDVGCGGGHNVCSLAEARPDAEIIGLDLAPHQVARARKRARRFGDRVRFVEGSALDLPFEDGEFDLVVSIGSIKHWPDMQRGVSECVRVLRRGGRLVIAEADRGCRLEDAQAFVRRWRLLAALGPISLAMFRTWVAGQGIDAPEAQAMLDACDLSATSVERVAGAPFLLMNGRR